MSNLTENNGLVLLSARSESDPENKKEVEHKCPGNLLGRFSIVETGIEKSEIDIMFLPCSCDDGSLRRHFEGAVIDLARI